VLGVSPEANQTKQRPQQFTHSAIVPRQRTAAETGGRPSTCYFQPQEN
jgi:hypothetical protein